MTRHFLTLTDLSRDELGYLIQRAIELKTMLRNGQSHTPRARLQHLQKAPTL